jgi:hypothetical protein
VSLREHLQQDFEIWRRERELVEAEMDRLITAVSAGGKEDRTVRALQFAALIERREAAARKILPPRDLAEQVRLSYSPDDEHAPAS